MATMLMVVALYSICAFNDKYAVSKAGYNGYELTFLMAAGTVPFLGLLLPFADRTFTICPQSFFCIVLIALCKYIEFFTGAAILKEMSVFELKAWLGIILFVSYFSDVLIYDLALSWLKIIFIAITAAGLVIIASTGRGRVHYLKIAIPLVLYLTAKFGYGFVMVKAEEYISTTMTLFFALVLLAILLVPMAKPWNIAKNSPEGVKGVAIVVGCKLPNALGLMGENAVAATSLANYSFIQPMILLVALIIGLFSKEQKPSPLNIAGSIICTAGILGFQFV